jgi:release factor glutamine methyltransferase
LAPSDAGTRYLPDEDTRLLKGALERFSGMSCLEIGFGSGAVISSVAGRFALAVGTDIVALGEAKLAGDPRVELVIADRASCFRDGIFDLVFFNPPYLPSWPIEDATVDGGPSGVEVPLSFLQEGLRVLEEDGTIVALLSTEGDLESFLSHCNDLGLEVESMTEKRLFYETLAVFTIRRGEESSIRRQG